jgi:hypothetical protein
MYTCVIMEDNLTRNIRVSTKENKNKDFQNIYGCIFMRVPPERTTLNTHEPQTLIKPYANKL